MTVQKRRLRQRRGQGSWLALRVLTCVGVSLMAQAGWAAEIGFRTYHRHEVLQLIGQPVETYPHCYEQAAMLQIPPHLHPAELLAEARTKLKTNTITEEFIIIGKPADSVDEAAFDPLVKMIAKAEQAGWEWGDLIVYREPIYATRPPGQPLLPGPWRDRRLISAEDIASIRARLVRSHAQGVIKKCHYRICGLIHSWKNIDEDAKAFINTHLDGLYVEMNTWNNTWRTDGVPTTIGKEFVDPGVDLAPYGWPGTIDTARMIKWCLDHGKRAGITTGANINDRWLQAMYGNFFVHLRNLQVDPAADGFVILLHHNRKQDDGRLAYFPETEEHSVTFLVDWLVEQTQPAVPCCLDATEPRPNVILIYTDDHGYTDLGVLGIDRHVDTPNMDTLARGGALMTAGYSSAPQCQPSRAGLMVGRIQNEFAYPHNECDAGEGVGCMPRIYPTGTDRAGQPVLTIADRMKKLGYVTGFSGKWHLGPTNHPEGKHEPCGRGFDYYWTGAMNSGSANLTLDGQPVERHTRKGLPDGVANRVILQGKYAESFIDLSQAGQKPFFLYLPLFGPHIPLIETSDPYYMKFPRLDYPHYDDWRDDRRRMGLALIKSIDDVVGGVMAKLREHGIEENTLVLFAGDNGAPTKMGQNGPGLPGGPPGTKGGVWNGSNNVPMRGEKGSLFEGGIRVPMFAYWKGRIMPGTVIDEMVTTLDLTATTLKVGGGTIPAEFDGVDLLPRLTGSTAKIDRQQPMFWEFWQTQAVRVGDWKLWRSNTQELLFHIAEDPYELTDRGQTDAEVATRLRTLLDQWSTSLPRLSEPRQDASRAFAWPLAAAPQGTKPDPRYRVPYANPEPAAYPAPIEQLPPQ